MANFLTSLFGRAEKKEEPLQPVSGLLQEYDEDYIRYCIELEQIVSALEENLHASDDPREIAMQTLKVACSFYGGNWAGILEVDLDLDVWNPLWWFSVSSCDKTMELFQEVELAKYMPNWVKALHDGTPIIVPNVKSVQKEHPEEYAVYKRLLVDTVIGVPFGPNPVGFLAIRNPTRYINRPSMMSILAYV